MANNDANIDLLFRNGLKDLEVLPPVEAWNNILPVIRKRQRPVTILRSAALIAVILSISFLAYRWGHDMSDSVQGPLLAYGEESVQSRNTPANNQPERIRSIMNQVTAGSDNLINVDQTDTTYLTGKESIIEIDPDFVTGSEILTVNRQFLLAGNTMAFRDLRLENKTDADLKVLDDFTSDVPKEKIDRWTLMAMASPTFYLGQVPGSDDISRQISSSEQSQISYSGGVAFAYKISSKLSIQSGLYYSSIGQEVSGINSFSGFRPYDYTKGDHNFEVMTSSGRIYTNNADIFLLDNSGDRVLTRYTNDIFDPAKANLSYISNSLFQNFSYLEMPVILRYKFIDKNIDFNLIGGVSYNLLVNNSVHTVMDGTRYPVGKTSGLNQFMVSSSLGMGMEYSLSEKFSLNLEPTFRYYLNPFGLFPGVKAHPYSFGIFSGLSYKF